MLADLFVIDVLLSLQQFLLFYLSCPYSYFNQSCSLTPIVFFSIGFAQLKIRGAVRNDACSNIEKHLAGEFFTLIDYVRVTVISLDYVVMSVRL